MLYILIFSIIVKIISLLNIPIEQAYLTFIIMMETPLNFHNITGTAEML